MAAIFVFRCSCCGHIHKDSPSYGFEAPDHYAVLSEHQRATIGHLTSDTCTITHEGRIDRFIRAVLEVPIHGASEPFTWGLWVSVSEQSFRRYTDPRGKPQEGEGFFGWVCNRLPYYPAGETLATDVVVQRGGTRPLLLLHHGSANDHPLILDQRNGISVAKARQIAEHLRHGA